MQMQHAAQGVTFNRSSLLWKELDYGVLSYFKNKPVLMDYISSRPPSAICSRDKPTVNQQGCFGHGAFSVG